MVQHIFVILATAIIFVAMVLSLAMKPDLSKKVLGVTLVVASLGGFIFYGYGYSYVESNLFLAIMKALNSTFSMLVGGNDLDKVSAAPYLSDIKVVLLFWVVSTMAHYALAGAVINLVGAKLLKQLRLFLSRSGNLVLIYGVGPEALALGKECVQKEKLSVVFLSADASNDAVLEINRMGAAIKVNPNMDNPTPKMLNGIGLNNNRTIQLYCMDKDQKNYTFAKKLRSVLKAMGIAPEKTSLVLFGEEANLAGKLQVYKKGEETVYGYGNVSVFQLHEQVARLMIRKCPPCDTMTFDQNGKAQDDFETLIIGFGRLGQNVLLQLIRNGQFAGSTFKATVVDPNCVKATGYLFTRCPELQSRYQIDLIEKDGRSADTFAYIEENLDRLKYVALAVADERVNVEIARQVTSFLRERGKNIPIVICGKKSVLVQSVEHTAPKEYKLYTRENLDFSKLDYIAMKINHSYSSDKNQTLWEDWRECDYFSRMSCRAVADYIPAFLRMLGMTEAEVLNRYPEKLELTPEQEEVFGLTEHIRWCAFHYTMGYKRMPWEEWERRKAVYLKQKKSGKKPSLRLGKDQEKRLHICLIPWEELEELNVKEREVTGQNPDYKQKDLDNVLMIPELIG